MVTAVATSAMARTCVVRLAASRLTLPVRSFHVPAAPGTLAWPPRRPLFSLLRLATVTRFTKDCHDLGIVIHGTFILGLPGETKETIEETIRFAKEINPHTIQVSLAAPYPGTFLYNQARENNWLHEDEELVTDLGTQIAPLSYPHLSHTEIFDSVETFYKQFYFRAPKIAAIVGEMVRSPDMMKRRLREGVEFFRFLRERRDLAV